LKIPGAKIRPFIWQDLPKLNFHDNTGSIVNVVPVLTRILLVTIYGLLIAVHVVSVEIETTNIRFELLVNL